MPCWIRVWCRTCRADTPVRLSVETLLATSRVAMMRGGQSSPRKFLGRVNANKPFGEMFSPMNRSASVTWAAITTSLASLPPFVLGLLFVLDFLGIAPHRGADPTIFTSSGEDLMGILMTMIPATWGLATSIGLLGLKRWARYSIIVFSGLNIVFMVVGFGLGMILRLALAKQHHFTFIGVWDFAYYVGVPVFYIGISVWFLMLFNRPGVVEQFEGTTVASS
jgi:hypothetical protein